ncbi:hypothetical protein ACQR35_09555 [Pseudarthrobacter sp. J1738]
MPFLFLEMAQAFGKTGVWRGVFPHDGADFDGCATFFEEMAHMPWRAAF